MTTTIMRLSPVRLSPVRLSPVRLSPVRLSLGLAGIMLLAACAATPEKAPDPVALVQMAKASEGAVNETVPLYGAAEAGTQSERTLPATLEAVVAAIAAPAGTAVKPGALVLRLEPSAQAQLDLAKARSDATLAEAAYARAQRLRGGGLVGDGDVEAARAGITAAQATLDSLRRRGSQLTVTTPVAGVVDAVLVKPGDLVAVGTPLARVATGGAVRARFGIDPALVNEAVGGHVVVAPANGGAGLTLPVSGINRVVDPATRLAAVFVDIPASAGLAAGQPLRGDLLRSHAAHGVVIPYAAVQDEGGVPFVYVVKDGVAHHADVKLGAQAGDAVIVLSGVAPGDMVVTTGGTALDDGTKVRTGARKPAAEDDK